MEFIQVRYAQNRDEDLLSHLEKYDLSPSHLFLTHMHPDHTAGIPVLSPLCNVYYGILEDIELYHRVTGDHLKNRQHTHLLDRDLGRSIAPFDRVLDIFGDGALWALSTPGHTRDHFSYLINTAPTPNLIVGDAELTGWGMKSGVFMGSDYGQEGGMAARHSAEMIRDFHARYPHIRIWFSHDEKAV